MVTKQQLLNQLPVYVGSMQVLKYDQLTSDIITELLKEHEVTKKDYDKIYKFFWDGNIISTAKSVFSFLKKNIRYDIESGAKQTLKSPSALLVQGKGDCKQYAQFIGGILGAIQRNEKLNFEWYYTFASYNTQKAIQHVFVTLIYKGKKFEIDPVLSYFNEYKSFTYSINKKTKDMALYKISGVGNEQVGKTIFGKALKAVSKPVVAVAKAIKDVVVEVGTFPARNAFLLIVRLNVFNIATKMGAKLSVIEPKLSTLWKKLGGNWNTLKGTIIKGAKNKIGASINGLYNPNAIGFAEPVSATAVAVATPILIAVKEILKSVGIEVEDLINAGKDIAISKAEQLVNDNLPPEVAKVVNKAIEDKTGIIPSTPAVEDYVIPNMENPNAENIKLKTNVNLDKNTNTATIKTDIGGYDYKKLLIPAGGLLAIYFITKKK